MSLQYLKEHHSDGQGYIKIDECEFILNETVKRIEEYQSTEIDVEIEKLRESDLLDKLLRNLVMRQKTDSLLRMMDLEKLAESNLKELVNDLLRAA